MNKFDSIISDLCEANGYPNQQQNTILLQITTSSKTQISSNRILAQISNKTSILLQITINSKIPTLTQINSSKK